MHKSRRAQRHEKIKKRVAYHWTRTLYLQLAAYGIVLAFWFLPIPNPVKLLAVTFHEMSHALAALVTGGRVFGYAIAPGGAGVTLGIGGNLPLILLAGHIGSCAWGILLYYASARWRSIVCLIILMSLLFASSFFGWLNEYTYIFGGGALFLLVIVAFLGDAVRLFFVRLVGSACCLYAPFEVLGELFRLGGAPSVMGVETTSDLGMLAQLSGIPVFIVGALIMAVQAGILVWLVRLTCTRGAKRIVKEETHEAKMVQQVLHDIHSHDRRIVLR